MDDPPSPDHPNTFTKWWKSKPFLLALAVFFALAAVVVPVVLSLYPPLPTEDAVERPEGGTIDERPEIQQR